MAKRVKPTTGRSSVHGTFRDRMADHDLPSVITGSHHPEPGFS